MGRALAEAELQGVSEALGDNVGRADSEACRDCVAAGVAEREGRGEAEALTVGKGLLLTEDVVEDELELHGEGLPEGLAEGEAVASSEEETVGLLVSVADTVLE